MAIRIELEPGETLAEALRKFRKLILAEGAFPPRHCEWHEKRHDVYLNPSILNRRRRWRTRVGKKGFVPSGPEPKYAWIDDLVLRPRRSRGPIGRLVVT